MKTTLATALEARGYTSLTAVQEAVTAPELEGQDLLVSAQTGSGKTVGFGLAIASRVLGDLDHFEAPEAPLALVIAPTRELAMQVKRELAWLFADAGAVLASTVGGMDMRDERRALARGAHIVVATPGRLRDHIMRGTIDLSEVRALVLDEADEMLDLGFREDLEFILESAPEERQTLLFSATVPSGIAKLAQRYQNEAVRVATTSGTQQHADIEYRAFQVAARDGENAIINILRYFEAPNAIVFCNTRALVNRLTTRLSNRGFSVVALSGELSQSERTHALQAMRDGRARVCVATDVAARGIDLPNLDLVVHAELPNNQETLLHRSGRTGRAGRKGVSALIVPPANRKKAERLLRWAKVTAGWSNAPSADEVLQEDEQRMLASPVWSEEIAEADRATLDTLIAIFSPEQIAAAYLRLHRERHTAPEDLSPPDTAPRPRAAFGPSVWFALQGGRATGAEPRRLLPMLCKRGDLSRDDIGAIRIEAERSLVELRQSAVPGFLQAVGPEMTLENGARLERLSQTPDLAAPSLNKARKAPNRPGKPDQAKQPGGKGYSDARKPPKPRAKPAKSGPSSQGPASDDVPAKPARSSDAVSPKSDRKPRSKGPKPPAGKPSSKKNRARQKAMSQNGGRDAPKRKPTSSSRSKPHRKG